MTTQPTIRFYFSFRSPFAAIAFYRLRRAAAFNDIEIDPVPVWPDIIFGGHMDNPTDNIFKLAYIFADAARQADMAGMNSGYFRALARQFTLPEAADYRSAKVGFTMPVEPWQIPHHAFLYAAEHQRGRAFGEAIFARRFNLDGDGSEDVMDPAVVKRIADSVGLDGTAAATAHSSGTYDAHVSRYIAQSERDGVFGVPFFALDRGDERATFWGNDRLEYLLGSIQRRADLPIIPPASVNDIQPGRA